MASFYGVLSAADLEYIHALPEVIAAKARLDDQTSGKVYFNIELTESIRVALRARLGLDLSSVGSIPMRWIKGETQPHVDRATSSFEHTYLVYLNDAPGQFILGDSAYPIAENTGYVFNEGLLHRTEGVGNEPRLLLGPMNEMAEPVGAPAGLYYYANQSDAENTTNSIAFNYVPNYVVGSIDYGSIAPVTSWRLAASSSGSSSQAVVYVNGNTLNSDGDTATYHLYPAAPCFLEGSKILCEVDGVEKYVPVEELRTGTLVKTSRDGFKKVVLIGKGSTENPGTEERIENRLYRCSPEKYPALTEDLFITGCHSILEFPITEAQKDETIRRLGKLFVTDKKYRLMACVDERAEPWNSAGTYTIYHFALEHTDDGMNYGVYANGGLLVESCCIRSLRNRSNMTFVE
jgi:hypothetical protein